MTGERFRVERQDASHWRVVDALQWDEGEAERFEGNEVECRAVATALHRLYRLHECIDAVNLGQEFGLNLAKLADVEQTGEVYNLLIELVDSVLSPGAEDAEGVAKKIVQRLDLGTVCSRCGFAYLGVEIPEVCELCDLELEHKEAA